MNFWGLVTARSKTLLEWPWQLVGDGSLCLPGDMVLRREHTHTQADDSYFLISLFNFNLCDVSHFFGCNQATRQRAFLGSNNYFRDSP